MKAETLDATKIKRIPHYVSKQYGGTRGFKKAKREQLKAFIRAYADLRVGCVFLPGSSYEALDKISNEIDHLEFLLCEKTWGR